jgi:hypothetical protein
MSEASIIADVYVGALVHLTFNGDLRLGCTPAIVGAIGTAEPRDTGPTLTVWPVGRARPDIVRHDQVEFLLLQLLA